MDTGNHTRRRLPARADDAAEDVLVSARTGGWQLTESSPEAYERYLVPAIFEPFAERLVELVAPRPGARVLDVACGTGIVARRAAERVGPSGSVVGVDRNGSILDVAKAAVGASEPPIRWLAADASAIPLADEWADCVLCQQGVQFFAQPAAALRELRRVLVPGGRLALSAWCSLEVNPGFDLLVTALERHAGPDVAAIMRAPFARDEDAGLRALVAGAGLRDASFDVHTEAVRFPSANDFLRREVAASPLAGPFAALPGAAREAIAADLTAALGDQGVVFPMRTFVATALR